MRLLYVVGLTLAVLSTWVVVKREALAVEFEDARTAVSESTAFSTPSREIGIIRAAPKDTIYRSAVKRVDAVVLELRMRIRE